MKRIISLSIVIIFCFATDLDLMFWNVENLFDIKDDPVKRDNDFLPGGAKRYTYRSYCLKVQHLADVINHVNPDLLGMVEVENKDVLHQLCTHLRNSKEWDIVIDDGPDIRGIDPALIYKKDKFKYCSHCYFPVFIEERGYYSRPIMRIDLSVLESNDTLSVFINHWPSRRGGKPVTDKYRLFAAIKLKEAIHATLNEHPNYRMVITGDFNDDKQDECIRTLIDEGCKYLDKKLPGNIKGTYYHDGEWIHFDHFLINNFDGSDFEIQKAVVCAPFWIREKTTNGPFRYYKGLQQSGGYSDHYPILIKLVNKRKNVE